MSARSSELNLLPKEIWEKGLIGQLLTWVLSVGRYVVVFTELIVISAFLYRFGLDRTLTDLHESIKNKQAVIAGYGDLEPSFRRVQTQLDHIHMVSRQPKILSSLDALSQVIPADAYLTGLAIDQNKVVLDGLISSQSGLATLLNQAQSQPQFKDVVLENVSSLSPTSTTIQFKMTLVFNQT